jgi:CubicO group peptidase (beta-lactamase class C family)
MLLTRDGERLLETCVGYADRATRTPVTPATRFGIASVTKMFTACTVVSLVREGLVAFETPIVDVLPADRRPRSLLPSVTLHHLLCHTSGIADYCEEDEDSPAYLADYAELWGDLPSYSMTRPADFLPLFGELPPYRPPGECFQYSNAGYIVLGLVIEELTGRPTPTSCSSACSILPGCRRAASTGSTKRSLTWRSGTGGERAVARGAPTSTRSR